MRDERAVITMDLVLEDMKKELKRIGLCMLCIYSALFLLICGPFLLIFLLGLLIQDVVYILSALLSMIPYFVIACPFVIVHAMQIIRRIRMIRNPDFTVSTKELLSLDKRFNLKFFLFSIEHFLYPPWLVLIRAFQYVMGFGDVDEVFVEKRIADYSFVGDQIHLILYHGKVVGVYNARLYRREDEKPFSNSWD